MAIERAVSIYDGPGGPFEGLTVVDTDWTEPKPGVMLVPNVLGTKEADFKMAEQLARLGYAVLVVDLYGQGKRASRDDEDMGRYMNLLNADRAMLRDRMLASLETLKSLDAVDPAKTAAIGFCFGGKAVLDLVRCGGDTLGVVSFHGVYDAPDFANVDQMRARVLVCHGWDDPLTPPDITIALAQELTAGGADWQLLAFGHTGHGFTDKAANMPERGVAYQPESDRRAKRAMRRFLKELFA